MIEVTDGLEAQADSQVVGSEKQHFLEGPAKAAAFLGFIGAVGTGVFYAARYGFDQTYNHSLAYGTWIGGSVGWPAYLKLFPEISESQTDIVSTQPTANEL